MTTDIRCGKFYIHFDLLFSTKRSRFWFFNMASALSAKLFFQVIESFNFLFSSSKLSVELSNKGSIPSLVDKTHNGNKTQYFNSKLSRNQLQNSIRKSYPIILIYIKKRMIKSLNKRVERLACKRRHQKI